MTQTPTTADRPASPARRTWCVLLALGGLMVILTFIRLGATHDPGQPPALRMPAGSFAASSYDLLLGNMLRDRPGMLSLMDIRAQRVWIAILLGASLSGSGVALQSLLRNPLAEPFILGLSTGAAVGVMAQMLLAHEGVIALMPVHAGAMLGALITMALVYVAGRRHGMIDPLGMLLVGVVISTINAAIIMLLNYISGPAGIRDNLAQWMMGRINESIDQQPWALPAVALLVLIALAVLWWYGRAMDVASFSDAEAASMGVNLRRLRSILFLMASVLAAVSVVLAGPVAFVGLICPHFVRLLLGPSHRALVIGAAFAGASLILLGDAAVVLLDFGQGRLPIGIFTAMIGGVTFLFMLRPHLGRDM